MRHGRRANFARLDAIGLRQIKRNAQGSIRSRLYFDNLCHIQIPGLPTLNNGLNF